MKKIQNPKSKIQNRRLRPGWSLVELLTVLLIIGWKRSK